MTQTFRDNCDTNIVQQTSCEPPFLDVQMQLETYFFVPFVRPCIHHNYGVLSGNHPCRDCVWHVILNAEHSPWRASVSSCGNSILHDLNKALFRKENSSEQSHGQNRMTMTNTKVRKQTKECTASNQRAQLLPFRELITTISPPHKHVLNDN